MKEFLNIIIKIPNVIILPSTHTPLQHNISIKTNIYKPLSETNSFSAEKNCDMC